MTTRPGVWSFVLTPILSVAASDEVVQWTAIIFIEREKVNSASEVPTAKWLKFAYLSVVFHNLLVVVVVVVVVVERTD